ncbi:MAG TPA: hypothetical protein DCP51_08335 [Clostridiales bacterium]|nr:hypothetical protein [Clostridiales bacterium]
MKKLLALRKSKKGFTLVEIIVVLVIVAILAAIAIPQFSGFVNRANSQQTLAEARAVYVAAQAVVAEENSDGTVVAGDITAAKVNTLIGENYLVDGAVAGEEGYFSVTLTSAKITGLTYTSGGYTSTYASGAWTTVKV